ncbi:hypothetical protein FPQ14_11455 [Gilliamella apicola]|uniref:Uncharacterized protein n=1 Tax=Gilliamella apicola TaxID=1196095 RepID=A0A556RGE3_9GAMM|nr:hypothetical protein [Gilliamella apicola]TSJ87953.1 hypothetical protein FPQ14_11455 [Gilliamella apicola]
MSLKPILSCVLGLSGLLFISINSAYGLDATTANFIHGHQPVISFDNGKTSNDNVLPLLFLNLPDKQIEAVDDNSSSANPIILNKQWITFNDIKTSILYENYPSTTLLNIISKNKYWFDSDGDDLSIVTGYFKIKWQTSDGTDITNQVKNNPDDELDSCKAPYKLSLSADSGSLVTRYGVPDIGTFKGGSHIFYLQPKNPKVCYAQPNVANDSSNNTTYPDLDGPNWAKGRGFIPQNVNYPGQNFPTVASNNLKFYLILKGTTPEEIIDINGRTITSADNSLIVLRLAAEDTPGWGKSKKEKALKIQFNELTPNPKFTTPSRYYVYADKDKKKILYSFLLQRWFVAKGAGIDDSYQDAINYCKGIGYRVPSTSDYTNANTDFWKGGIPNRNINGYRRQLSYRDSSGRWIGGLFNEWGTVFSSAEHYPGTKWEPKHPDDWYWTTDFVKNDTEIIRIDSGDGDLGTSPINGDKNRTACVTP